MAEAVLAQLPPRAAVARLQLQVRQALEEAVAAEARAASAVLSDETAVMQRTVADLMADGRAAFDRALEQERADAAAAIAAAHLRAAGLPATAQVAAGLPAAPATVARDGTPATSPVAGASRASVAMLTLQVRAAEREAAEAEARVAEAEQRAIADLRAHLAQSIQLRATELGQAMDQARADATATIAAAHRAARRPVTPAAPAVPEAAQQVRTGITLPAQPEVGATRHGAAFEPAVEHPTAVERVAGTAAALPAEMTSPSMDPEVFATMFATVLANMLDDRLPAGGTATPAAKPSFWAHARHPDVLLLGLATVLMLVILAAWLA